LESYGVDVIIIGRGGGSIEELWEFNDERLARTVYNCSIPVISAVGHDSDTTIIDYVADRVASTPTAAAELAVPDMVKIAAYLDQMRGRLDGIMQSQAAGARAQAAHYAAQLRALSPGRVLQDRKQSLDTARKRMQVMMEHRLSDGKQSLLEQENSLVRLMNQRMEDARNRNALYAQKLHGLSPLRQLERGYAYVSNEEGHGVSSISQAPQGSILQIEVTDGRIRAKAEEIIPVIRERIGEE
jgi:exodeoxyribonuclease VII large subunit